MAEIALRSLVVAGIVLAGGCARELAGEDPPAASFYFPVGLTASQSRCNAEGGSCNVFVVNSNFDLRFNAGWVSSIDVVALLPLLDAGAGSDELSAAVVDDLLVPSLGGDLALDADGDLGVLTARGNAPITRIDIAPDGMMSCGAADAKSGLSAILERTDCDRDHFTHIEDEIVQEDLAERIRERADVTQEHVSDAFGVVLFATEPPALCPPGEVCAPGACATDRAGFLGCAAVGYLGSGIISILSIPTAGALVHERAINLGNTFGNDLELHPEPGEALLAATTADIGSQRTFSFVYDVDLATSIASGEDAAVGRSIFSEVGGVETVDIAFSGDGTRAYAANRGPDTVAVLDTRLGPAQVENGDGTYTTVRRPNYNVIGDLPLKGRPSSLTYVKDRIAGEDLVAVVSFDDNALFILSPAGDSLRLERRIDRIADGPWDVLHVRRGERDLLFITAFNDHGVIVVDITAADPANFTVFPNMVRNSDVDE